jgi:anti-anti-sigma factor
VTADSVQVRAVRRNGACVLQIAGELDAMAADTFAEHADAAVRSLRGPVLVYLSGLTFIDAGGARVLDAVMRTRPGGRLASVRACPRHVRRILDMLGLPLDGRPGVPSPGGPADPVPGARARQRGVGRSARCAGAPVHAAGAGVRTAVPA